MRGIHRLVCGLAIGLLVLTSFTKASPSPGPGSAIVGYVFPQNTTLQACQIDASKLTRINYAFANIKNGRMVNGFSMDKENFAYLHSLKQQNSDLTILVSVGGWLWSTNFSDVSLTLQSRAIFIQSVMDFIRLYDLDGLDIDWEYPGMSGAGHTFRSKDKRNFTLLLKELRSRFDAETARTQKRLYLTIAAGASDEFLAHTEMSEVQRYVDTVNLMAYDYYEPGADSITGHHAPLFTNPVDPKKISADASVQAFEKAGVPASKIILGLPFYGHVWGQVANHNHGLYQPGKAIPNAYAPYRSIVETMLPNGFVRFWDPVASAPYLYSDEKQIFVSYEDPQSLIEKCSYVKSNELGGVMFWEYSGDPSGVLLTTIYDTLNVNSATRNAKP